VNVEGPDGVVATSEDVAFWGRTFQSSPDPAYGIMGFAENKARGDVYGGFFETSSSGKGVHYGLRAEGYGSSWPETYGLYGYAENTSLGTAYGGYFGEKKDRQISLIDLIDDVIDKYENKRVSFNVLSVAIMHNILLHGFTLKEYNKYLNREIITY